MRYLAIDYGTKRTGLAICDSAETIASPLTVIQGQKELLKKIAEVVETAAEILEAFLEHAPIHGHPLRATYTYLSLQYRGRRPHGQFVVSLDIPVCWPKRPG